MEPKLRLPGISYYWPGFVDGSLGLRSLRLETLFLAAVLISGCQSSKAPDQPLRLAEPIAPQAETILEPWNDCFEKPQPSGQKRLVTEMLLSYLNRGRDFRGPQGPDGYLLRVILLDRNSRPVRIPADVTVALFAETGQKNYPARDRPVRLWQIRASNLDEYWTPSNLLDSYLFRLDWGPVGPGPGNYRFLVRLSYKQQNIRETLCSEITFQDLHS